MQFGLMIIGDEILHGSRVDKHMTFFKALLQSRGLDLAWVQYLPDDRPTLVRQLQRSFADGQPVFITGGIGATPDDHTRQAAAMALGRPLCRHPEALKLIEARSLVMGEALDSPGHHQRAKMADFAQGVALIPNPFNQIAGFCVHEHYFLPGFPQMAHPMAEWVLQTHYQAYFHQTVQQSVSAQIEGLPESAIGPLMEDIEQRWPGVKTFSLPTIRQDAPEAKGAARFRLEFGLKAADAACAYMDEAWQYAEQALWTLGARAIKRLS